MAIPFIDTAAEMVVEEFGCSILVNVATHAGYEAEALVNRLFYTEGNALMCLSRLQIIS